jgi:DNA modification methylase
MKLSDIKLNPDNPRLIKDDKFKLLVKSLKELPVMSELREVILDENNMIIGGNMRYRAAVEAGWSEIPVKVFTQDDAKRNNELTNQNKTYEEYVQEILIKDNVSGGEWDWDLLANEWDTDELEDWGLDLPVDFSEDKEVEEDEAPEVSSEPAVSRMGEIYQLGRHMVMCGDSTKDVDKLFDKATIAFTSPPYNVGHNLGYDNDNKYNEYKDDNPDYLDLLNEFNALALAKCKYSFVNLQLLAGNRHQVVQWLFENNDLFCDVAFWKKSQVAPAMARNVMNSQVECIFILGGNGSLAIQTGYFKGTVSNFLETNSASGENENAEIHSATYPVAFVSHFINNFTKKGDSVYDAFIGTGTTLIACEQTERTCYGMELDPKYVDVIRKRYVKFVNGELPDNWEELTPVVQ